MILRLPSKLGFASSSSRRARKFSKHLSLRVVATCGLGLGLLGLVGSASGYALEGYHWQVPSIPLRVQMGPSAVPLADGSLDFDAVVENALDLWNEQFAGAQFAWTIAAPGTAASYGDGVSSMQLSATIYGDKFGASVLAVTLINSSGNRINETDVLFNTANKFNSYRGTAYQAGAVGYFDLHRIALHELGHVLGLDHPDDFGQTVDAIMNARVSTFDALQTDDIAGAVSLYGAPPNPPAPTGNGRIVQISTRGSVGTGDNVMIGGFIIPGSVSKKVIVRAIGPSLGSAGVTGALQNPSLELHDGTGALIQTNDDWRETQEQEIIATTVPPTDDRESAMVAELAPGNYTAIVQGVGGGTGVALVEVYDLEPASGKMANISTRARVDVGDNVLIGGFIVTGPQTEKLVVRALGPSLTANGVSGALPNPVLEIYNGNGDLLSSNDNFSTSVNVSLIGQYGLAPANGLESAIYFEGAPGSYTAVVRGFLGATGIGLVEVYGVN